MNKKIWIITAAAIFLSAGFLAEKSHISITNTDNSSIHVADSGNFLNKIFGNKNNRYDNSNRYNNDSNYHGKNRNNRNYNKQNYNNQYRQNNRNNNHQNNSRWD